MSLETFVFYAVCVLVISAPVTALVQTYRWNEHRRRELAELRARAEVWNKQYGNWREGL